MNIDTSDFDSVSREVLSGLSRRLERPMQKACMIVLRDAKKNCPVDTGMLRNSIQYKTHVDGTKTEGYVYTNIDYAPYVEIGTGRQSILGSGADIPGMRAKPFLLPSLEANRAAVNACFVNIL